MSEKAMPNVIYVVSLPMQQPTNLIFIKAELIEPKRYTTDGSGIDRPSFSNSWPTYDTSSFTCVSAADIEIDAHADIVVFPGLVYHECGVVAAVPATPLEYFSIGMRLSADNAPREPKEPKVRKLTLTPTVIARLLEEYPWLTENDVNIAYAQASTGGGGGGGAPPDHKHLTAEDLEDELVADLQAALELKRAEWEWEDDDVAINFYTWVNGGVWTKKFVGKVVDSVSGKARSHTYKYCEMFQWQKSKTYSFS
jgi:hypothetical protein